MSEERSKTPPQVCGSDGIWLRGVPVAPGTPPRPALFLDRDGAIVEEVGHLRSPEDVRLIGGAADVIVVTNQSGIGRGLFGWAELIAVEERIEAELAALGARLDAVLACPFHPDGWPPYRHPDHPARKPNPGLLLRAATAFAVELASSWIVGDRAGDMGAGRAAGLSGGMHVSTGWGSEPGEREAALACSGPHYRVLEAVSVAEARRLLPLLSEAPAGGGR